MPIVPNPDDNAREQTPLEYATDLLTESADAIREFLEVDECRCDQMVDDDTGDDLGPCAKCSAEDLLTRIQMFLEPDEVAGPGPFKVITRMVNHWEDMWTVDDEPERFATREEAEEAIAEHIANCEASRLSGEYERSDFRIIPADQPPNPQP